MIGKNIAELRKRKGFTLSELAERTNISKSYLSNIERNLNKNPSLEIMKRIASVLNVDMITLLKTNNDKDAQLHIEKEWIDFVNELKELGLEKDEMQQYKPLIEFIKWKNKVSDHK